MTFASVDWIMSLDPHWYSTIFGFILVAGQGLAGVRAGDRGARGAQPTSSRSRRICSPRLHFLDLGKLLLAFVMLWAYFSFSQLLIIWAGNLPEEIPFFYNRFRGGWQYVSLRHPARPFRAAVRAAALARSEAAPAACSRKVAIWHPRDARRWT